MRCAVCTYCKTGRVLSSTNCWPVMSTTLLVSSTSSYQNVEKLLAEPIVFPSVVLCKQSVDV